MAIYVNPNTVPWLRELYLQRERDEQERKARIELDRTYNILKNYGTAKNNNDRI